MDNKTPPQHDNAQTPDSGSKGKGKERDGDSSAESGSIANRLESSGRLALNALGAGPNLAGQRSSGKASGSSSFGSIEQSSTHAVGEASSRRLRSTGIGESLRSQAPLSGASAQAFDEFTAAEPTLSVGDAAPHEQSAHGEISSSAYTRSSDVALQETVDGAAVVDLLSGPSDELDAVLLGAEDHEAQDDTLTPEAAAKLRAALFPPDAPSMGPRWEDLLNFNPDFLTRRDPEAEFERQLHMGTSDMAEARDSWLNQWSDVLSAYTDHVWGDLEPLIKQAKKEVEEIVGNEGAGAVSETKALERLRQILAHIRGF